jgi:PRTRC genetic system protein B
MNGENALDDAASVTLTDALLVYRDGKQILVTRHGVVPSRAAEAPTLGPGRPVSLAFVRALARDLMPRVALEFLPASVLVRVPDGIAWWSAPRPRTLFLAPAGASGRPRAMRVPCPGLVWTLQRGQMLDVFVVGGAGRPTADAVVFRAPFWNVNEHGSVCAGTMRQPRGDFLTNLNAWEDAFFAAKFTHANCAEALLTSHPQGLLGFWTAAQEHGAVPMTSLVARRGTLLNALTETFAHG